jgi:hypothetical protein
MALIPLATQGNYLHIYDFRVKEGMVKEFIRLFNEFDYGDDNPMHKSPAQVRDGVLVQDVADEHRFWLIAEWSDIKIHAEIRKLLVSMKPAFVGLIEGGKFVPDYGLIVSSTPAHILDKASS